MDWPAIKLGELGSIGLNMALPIWGRKRSWEQPFTSVSSFTGKGWFTLVVKKAGGIPESENIAVSLKSSDEAVCDAIDNEGQASWRASESLSNSALLYKSSGSEKSDTDARLLGGIRNDDFSRVLPDSSLLHGATPVWEPVGDPLVFRKSTNAWFWASRMISIIWFWTWILIGWSSSSTVASRAFRTKPGRTQPRYVSYRDMFTESGVRFGCVR